MKNYYKILEIEESANPTEIKGAYRRLAKLYHPDANPHYVHAAEMFKKVNAAYHVLSNFHKKIAYDAQLKQSYGKADNYGSKPADAAERSKKEYANENHSDDHWFTDDPESVDDDPFYNAGNGFKENHRFLHFIKAVFFIDICLGTCFIYFIGKLDLSFVPKVYFLFGWRSWLFDMEAGIIYLMLAVSFSLFQLSLLLFDRISIFYTISHYLKVHDKYLHFVFAQALLKMTAAYCFIVPMFGITLFELSGIIFLFVILWNAFMTIFLLLNYMKVISDVDTSQ